MDDDDDDYGEDDEEDKKPNVEYLDSLNEYRKRSRSKEDVDGSFGSGPSGSGSRKIVKTNSDMSVNGHLGVNGYADVDGRASGSGKGTPGDVGMGFDDVRRNGVAVAITDVDADDDGMGSGDDPIVHGSCFFYYLFLGFSLLMLMHLVWLVVNGNPVPYSKITEEDHELMTPDEYTVFFEIMQTRT